MIKYLVAALCLLVPVAALAQGSKQSGADLPRFTVGTLPTTCTADRDLVLVTDADSAGNCALGSGTALAICGCNSTGTGFESTSGTSTSGTLPVTDDVSMAEGDVDDTREVRFEVDTLLDGSAGVTTGNVRVLHVPDEDIDLHDSQTDHEERYGIANVLDYGAACDWVDGINSSPTDDNVAVQAAIDAVDADDNLDILYFPRMCYVGTAVIDWKRGVSLVGTEHTAAGIVCADGTDTNCVEPSSSDSNFGAAVMKDFQVGKAGTCNPQGGECLGNTGSGCTTCERPTDTIGNGIDFDANGLFTGEGKTFDNIWVSGFPQWGVYIHGTQPLWAEGLNLWWNGYAAPDLGAAGAGTVSSATATSLTDTGAGWTSSEHIDKWVTLTGGVGAGQIRVITANDTDTLTVASWTGSGGATPDATSTYEIDFGGGLLVAGGGGKPVRGCAIDNISGDGNDPALVTVFSGNYHTNGDKCDFTNVKAEDYNTGDTLYGVRAVLSSMGILINGLSFSPGVDPTPENSAIFVEGTGIPELEYHNVGIAEAFVDYVLSTGGMDRPSDRIGIQRTHDGKLPHDIGFERSSAAPFTCASPTTLQGNRYFDTDTDSWKTCNGTAWTAGTELDTADALCFGDTTTQCIRWNAATTCAYFDKNGDSVCDLGEELSANCTACP